MRRFHRDLTLLVASIVGWVVAGQTLLYDGLAGCVHVTDTEYASGYSEAGFRRLALPAPVGEVRDVVGIPHHVSHSATGGRETWHYSRSPGDTHYHFRRIVVVDGIAVEKSHGVYVD